METKHLNPVKGLQTICKANVTAMIAVVIALISGILLLVFTLMSVDVNQVDNTTTIGILAILASSSGLLALISGLLIFISRIREIIGLVRLSKIHKGYKTALLLIAVGLGISVVVSLSPIDNTMIRASTQLLNLLCIASVYFILDTTAALLRNEGNEELAAKGLRVRTLYVSCNVEAVAVGLFALLPALALMADMAALVTSVLQFVALFQYIGFLGRAAAALKNEAHILH